MLEKHIDSHDAQALITTDEPAKKKPTPRNLEILTGK